MSAKRGKHGAAEYDTIDLKVTVPLYVRRALLLRERRKYGHPDRPGVMSITDTKARLKEILEEVMAIMSDEQFGKKAREAADRAMRGFPSESERVAKSGVRDEGSDA